MKGHSWQPVTTANLVRRMAEQVKKGDGEDVKQWHY